MNQNERRSRTANRPKMELNFVEPNPDWAAFVFIDPDDITLPIYAGGVRGAAASCIFAARGADGLIEDAERIMSIPLADGREVEWAIAINRLIESGSLTDQESSLFSDADWSE